MFSNQSSTTFFDGPNMAFTTKEGNINAFQRKIPIKRKFPGPAGLLPDKPPASLNDSAVILNDLENADGSEDEPLMVWSQATDAVFNEGSYRRLLSDFGLVSSFGEESGFSAPLSLFTVDWVRKKALQNRSNVIGIKVPFLAAVVQDLVTEMLPEPVLLLRDPTGEIRAAVDSNVWRELRQFLTPGTAIALRQVGVLCKKRQMSIVLTMNNIISLYNMSETGGVIKRTVKDVSLEELIASVDSWQNNNNNAPVNSLQKAVSGSRQFFATVQASKHSTATNRPIQNQGNTSFENLDWGNVLDDDEFNDSFEEMICTDSKSENAHVNISTHDQQNAGHFLATPQILSQSDSEIFDLTLSGVDIGDDFM